MSELSSRGTLTIDAERCKGCELCIPACRPGVLAMSSALNGRGFAYPACQLVCPDFCFEVFRYETPVSHEVG